MKELSEITLTEIAGGGDLPASTSYTGPSEAYIASILALLAPSRTVHHSD